MESLRLLLHLETVKLLLWLTVGLPLKLLGLRNSILKSLALAAQSSKILTWLELEVVLVLVGILAEIEARVLETAKFGSS